MSISYALLENNLTSDPNDYLAQVQTAGTADMPQIIERMIQRGSTVTKADALSVLEDFTAAIESLLLDGINVTTDLANFSLSIKGIFDGPGDSYNASRHQIDASLTPGKRLRQTIRAQARLIKSEKARPMPTLEEYLDFNSDTRGASLTAGGMAQIIGHRLQFDPADSQQGIFFIASDGTETRVSVVGQNKPARLMFVIPNTLARGDYSLQVRTILRGNTDLRTGTLKNKLTV